MSLYALSKLKLRNYDSFYKYLLLLSGDINLNPGPIQNPCKKCLGSVNKKIFFCKNCNFWFHKKCELPDNPRKFTELKNTVNSIYICETCSNNINVQIQPQQNQNSLDSLPFVDEYTLDDIFGSGDYNRPDEPDNIEEDLDYKIFKNGDYTLFT